MRNFIVTKAPVGLDGACEIVGVFSSKVRARAACVGAGDYLIAEVVPDRAYRSGTLLDVEKLVVMSAKEFKS
jgi:hypothetical protein